VGLSSAVLFDAKDPFNPINRRINIIVMNKMAEKSVRTDGGTVEVEAESGPSAQQLIKSKIESNNIRR
jgi:chemotaxis protein MotB